MTRVGIIFGASGVHGHPAPNPVEMEVTKEIEPAAKQPQ